MDAENHKSDQIHQLSRLKWACRRGMLELDVLLGDFLENGYLALEDDDKWLFIKLLECADPDLNAWLMGGQQPVDPNLVRIVEIVRQHVKSRS